MNWCFSEQKTQKKKKSGSVNLMPPFILWFPWISKTRQNKKNYINWKIFFLQPQPSCLFSFLNFYFFSTKIVSYVFFVPRKIPSVFGPFPETKNINLTRPKKSDFDVKTKLCLGVVHISKTLNPIISFVSN